MSNSGAGVGSGTGVVDYSTKPSRGCCQCLPLKALCNSDSKYFWPVHIGVGAGYVALAKSGVIQEGASLLIRTVNWSALGGSLLNGIMEHSKEAALTVGALLLVSRYWGSIADKTGLAKMLKEGRVESIMVEKQTEKKEEVEKVESDGPKQGAEVDSSYYRFSNVVGCLAGVTGGTLLAGLEFANSVVPVTSSQEEISDGDLIMEYIKTYGVLIAASGYLGGRFLQWTAPTMAYFALKCLDGVMRFINNLASKLLNGISATWQMIKTWKTEIVLMIAVLSSIAMVARPNLAVGLNAKLDELWRSFMPTNNSSRV